MEEAPAVRDWELLMKELQISGVSGLLSDVLLCHHPGFGLGAGSGQKLWFSFGGSVKGLGLIVGWE